MPWLPTMPSTMRSMRPEMPLKTPATPLRTLPTRLRTPPTTRCKKRCRVHFGFDRGPSASCGRPFFYENPIGTVAGMRILFLFLALSASACGRRDRPEPPTAEESARLNDAEIMLDDLANETGPE